MRRPSVQRLKTRGQFQAVLAGGIIARSGHFVLHRLHLEPVLPAADADMGQTAGIHGDPRPLFATPGVWLGAMVPKRWAKRAVTRNMIKRKIFSLADASARDPGADGISAAYVVRLRSAFDPRLYKSASSAPLKAVASDELTQLFTHGFGCA